MDKTSMSEEAIAQIVYEAMTWAADQSCTDSHPSWAPNGNSYAQDRARDAAREIAALTPPIISARGDDELHQLRATVARIRQALDWTDPADREQQDAAIIADADLSLRACAAKYGVGVSVVRTLRAKQEKTDG